jgi:anti-anti-sigma factor
MGDAVNRLLAERRSVVLDLRLVDFMDLHGLAVVMRATRKARADGGSFAVARPAPCVRRLVELVHAEGEVRNLPDGTDPLHAA